MSTVISAECQLSSEYRRLAIVRIFYHVEREIVLKRVGNAGNTEKSKTIIIRRETTIPGTATVPCIRTYVYWYIDDVFLLLRTTVTATPCCFCLLTHVYPFDDEDVSMPHFSERVNEQPSLTIQSTTEDTRAYTPGNLASSHNSP